MQYIFIQCDTIITVRISNVRAVCIIPLWSPWSSCITTSLSPTSPSDPCEIPVSPCSPKPRPHHLPSVTVCPPASRSSESTPYQSIKLRQHVLPSSQAHHFKTLNFKILSSSTSYLEYQAGGGKGLVDLVNQLTLERCHSFWFYGSCRKRIPIRDSSMPKRILSQCGVSSKMFIGLIVPTTCSSVRWD